MRVLLTSCGDWHLPRTARAFQTRDALAGLWIAGKNLPGGDPAKFRRAWLYHLAMKPFYHLAPQIVQEKMYYRLLPLWRFWLERQPLPEFDVVQAIAGYGVEMFQKVSGRRCLKVADCPNSHPDNLRTIWQGECDRWSPGEKVPIPVWMFARMKKDIECADVVLCPSEFVKESIIERGVDESRCVVNPFGVDVSIFQPREESPRKPRFVVVGTICLRKGHHYLFQAFDEVRKKLPEAELVVVGDYKSDFRGVRSRWQGSFTHYRGLSHPELAKLLVACSAFVLPSLEEGFARVIIEAMAAGLPIVATHESGASTLVRDGSEGLIVPSRDVAALSAAMIRVVEDEGINRAMGKAAAERGGSGNSWQNYGDRLLAEYAARL